MSAESSEVEIFEAWASALNAVPESTQEMISSFSAKNGVGLESGVVREIIDRSIEMHYKGWKLVHVGKVRETFTPYTQEELDTWNAQFDEE